jgi:hypothetical protein
VNSFKDLTVTIIESIDSLLSDAEVTKYDKQEQFKREHRSATLCPEGTSNKLADRTNELCRQLNLLEITFASVKDNPNIKLEKLRQ